MKNQMQTLQEGTIVGYESLSGGRVAIRFFKTRYGTLSEYIDIEDFPESYKSTLREIFNKDIPTDMEKAEEIKSLMYRYPFKTNERIGDYNGNAR